MSRKAKSKKSEKDIALFRNSENSSELNAAKWSVISYNSIEARNLSYNEAFEHLQKLAFQKVSGLCIITDEAASRFTAEN